jgi:hypothetical protein
MQVGTTVSVYCSDASLRKNEQEGTLMTRKFVGVCSLVILIAVAMLPDLADASWSPFNYEGGDGVNYYGIHEGNVYLHLGLPSDKQARKLARKLNKVLSKDTGFYDPGSGPCHDPKPGTQC